MGERVAAVSTSLVSSIIGALQRWEVNWQEKGGEGLI